jgi:predicted restriction endonuclease
LTIYEGACAISGYNAVQALEAAHIIPYKGEETNHSANGLLLRSDLHTLFDLRLIAIDTGNMSVLISPELSGTLYSKYLGKKIFIPKNSAERPSIDALNKQRKEANL